VEAGLGLPDELKGSKQGGNDEADKSAHRAQMLGLEDRYARSRTRIW
jgi:hypothetical protein